MSDVNSVYFSREDVSKGLMAEFIAVLCRNTYESENLMNDIHIKPEDIGAFAVEWVQVPWDHSYGGKFEFVDEDQEVCDDLVLPDGSRDYTPDGEDYLKWWLEENPGWEKEEWGHWHKNEESNYIPKKSPNFTFHIFDYDSGKPIAKDIPISEEKVNEIVDNYEKIKVDEELKKCLPELGKMAMDKWKEIADKVDGLSTDGCNEPYKFSLEDD